MPFAGLVLITAGCASRPVAKATVETPEQARMLREEEYDYVRVTGSRIPMRVPKSPIARPLPPISPVIVLAPDAFSPIFHRGVGAGRP